MQVTGDHVLTACYAAGSDTAKAEPCITIGELSAIEDGGVKKVRGSVTRSIPDGYELIEHGILYARDSEFTGDSFVYTDGSDGILKYLSTTKKMNGVVNLNVKVADENVTVTLRGYMILREDGKEELLDPIYTESVSGTWSGLNGS